MSGPKTDQSLGSWDDLRVALAVGREGSVRRAASALSVSHSTVLRRLSALERSAGVQLFDRVTSGWELTVAGQDVFDTALELEALVVALARRVEGRDLRLAGPVRVTLPDAMLPVIAEDLARIAASLPDVDLQITASIEFADLGLREADVAIRVAANPPPDLVGRRIGTVTCGVWGSEAYLGGRRRHDLASLDWISWTPDAKMGFARWLETNVPGARVALRVDTAWALREAVEAHAGVAVIPCVLGFARGWRRVRELPELSAPMWVLTHADLRTKARVRAVRDRLTKVMLARRPQIEGRRLQLAT